MSMWLIIAAIYDRVQIRPKPGLWFRAEGGNHGGKKVRDEPDPVPNTSPIWEGGGIAWGPHPREYYRPIPKKFKRAAIRSAFSFMAANDGIRVVELPELSKPKTKTIADFMKRQDIYEKRVLLLFEGKNEHLEESCRNIKGLAVKRSILVNPFDLVWAEHVLITSEALQKIEEVFSR